MPYDANRMQEWWIAEVAEANMPAPGQRQGKLGLERNEVIPIGKACKLDS
jgi:methylenetetrahydrofolate dehydrogenase (NADP+)/methenyltetrahydrofolate cyclohydrolase/formyltetrahydrofolate synthetase